MRRLPYGISGAISAGLLAGGREESGFPFTDDFNRTDGAVANDWIGSGAVSSNALVITPTAGANVVTNSDFEGAFSSGLAANWTAQGTPTFTEEGTVVHAGSKSQKIDAASNNQGIYKASAQTVGVWYKCSAWVYVVSGQIDFKGTIVDVKMNSGTGAWENILLTGKSTNAARPQLASRAAQVYYVDDVTCLPLTLATMGIYRVLPAAASTAYQVLVDPATIFTGYHFGVWAAVDNPAAPANGVLAYHDGAGKLRLDKLVAGTWTNLIDQSIAYDAAKKVVIKRSGTTYQLFYGTTQYGADQTISDAAIVAAGYCGIFSSDGGNSIDTFELLPLA